MLTGVDSRTGSSDTQSDVSFPAAVRIDDKPVFTGQVIDVDSTSSRVRVPRADTPRITLGTEVVVEIPDRQRRPIDLAAVVVERSEGGEEWVYGFRFTGAGDAEKIRRLLDRRSDVRFQPRGDPVAVEIFVPDHSRTATEDPDGTTHDGQLRDISASGMGLWISPEVDSALNDVEFLELRFSLPADEGGTTTECQFAGWIRHRALEGERIRYGICFEPSCTERHDHQQSVVLEYIRREQSRPVAAESAADGSVTSSFRELRARIESGPADERERLARRVLMHWEKLVTEVLVEPTEPSTPTFDDPHPEDP